jgi:hypothetical protein
MRKNALKVFNVIFLLFFGVIFSFLVEAKDDALILNLAKVCNLQYSGESCEAELILNNNTNKILEGKAFLEVNYQGQCSNHQIINFDGVGIKAKFSFLNSEWLNFSNWEKGRAFVSGFKINKEKSFLKLKIETQTGLCSGKYNFSFFVKGVSFEKEYVSQKVIFSFRENYSKIPQNLPFFPKEKAEIEKSQEEIISGKMETLKERLKKEERKSERQEELTEKEKENGPQKNEFSFENEKIKMGPLLLASLSIIRKSPLMMISLILSFSGIIWLLVKKLKSK